MYMYIYNINMIQPYPTYVQLLPPSLIATCHNARPHAILTRWMLKQWRPPATFQTLTCRPPWPAWPPWPTRASGASGKPTIKKEVRRRSQPTMNALTWRTRISMVSVLHQRRFCRPLSSRRKKNLDLTTHLAAHLHSNDFPSQPGPTWMVPALHHVPTKALLGAKALHEWQAMAHTCRPVTQYPDMC